MGGIFYIFMNVGPGGGVVTIHKMRGIASSIQHHKGSLISEEEKSMGPNLLVVITAIRNGTSRICGFMDARTAVLCRFFLADFPVFCVRFCLCYLKRVFFV